MAESLEEVKTAKFKKRSFIPEDHISQLFLHEIEYEDNSRSLTFGQFKGSQIVSYERLRAIHSLIGETLKHEEEYCEYRDWLNQEKEQFKSEVSKL